MREKPIRELVSDSNRTLQEQRTQPVVPCTPVFPVVHALVRYFVAGAYLVCLATIMSLILS